MVQEVMFIDLLMVLAVAFFELGCVAAFFYFINPTE